MAVNKVHFTATLFLFLYSYNVLAKNEDVSSSTLKQVHVLFRHGDRAPVHPYANDPYSKESNWPFGYAQLTLEGLQMQQKLGRWFRKRYDSLLQKHWNSTEIEVVATDVDRTINSAQANLQGLYSEQEDKYKFDKTLNWTPVPVRVMPKDTDDLLNVDKYCPRVADEVAKLDNDPRVKEVMAKCQALFALLTEKLGQKVDTIQEVDWAYDYFYIHEVHNITLPDWVLPHMPLMKEVSEFSFEMIAFNRELKRLRGGPLVKKLIADMFHRTGNHSAPNFMMYSGHDSTVACNLETLGVYNKISPPYASTVIYELHNVNDAFYVKVLYRNDTAIELPPHVLVIPGCEALCPITKFKSLLQDVIPEDYARECGVAQSNILPTIHEVFSNTDTMVVYYSLSAVLLITLVVISLLLLSCHVRRLRDRRAQEYTLLTQH